MKKLLFILPIFCIALAANAQRNYWQQHVKYAMQIEMHTESHQFTGTQELQYTNNSPDTLRQVFYHLYYNAFQPGSMLSERAKQGNGDRRVLINLDDLTQSEIGYQHVTSLLHDGEAVPDYKTVGTVLHVTLAKPILPGATITFSMEFNAQIPIVIRRTGHDNKEDIDYTMSQWYPKMAEYDEEGWHPDQYVAREFFGVFGDFDVKITIDKNYVLGGTGVLQNADEIGAGYASKSPRTRTKSRTKTWHFVAENVHDFAWAADRDFTHKSFQVENGPMVHLLYNPKTANAKNWEKLEGDIRKFFVFMNANFGAYDYPQFSLVQGGDGGMEYPMCTMVLGAGEDYRGFFGLFAHETCHNWYYGMLASNEQKYPWMDEGFTSFAEEEVMNFVFDEGKENPHLGNFETYVEHVKKGVDEPMGTGADYFKTGRNQVISSYFKGELFLMQMQYIVGEADFKRGMLRYYNQWKFKHPKPEDFVKIMEDVSGIQLDWFLNFWTQTTKLCDYAVVGVESAGPSGSNIALKNMGQRPMPVDVKVTLKNGKTTHYTIPLLSMYGAKTTTGFLVQKAWPWTNPTYTLYVGFSAEDIATVLIDPLQESCDVVPANNFWQAEK